MQIRKAETKDFNGFVRLRNICFNYYNTADRAYFNSFKEQIDRVVIAEDNHQVVGIVRWKVSYGCTDKAVILSLGVSPSYRGKGIATKLIEAIMTLIPSYLTITMTDDSPHGETTKIGLKFGFVQNIYGDLVYEQKVNR